MANPLFSRQYTITNLYTSIMGMPEQNPLSFFQLCPDDCTDITESIDPTCDVTWLETQAILGGNLTRPTRGLWSRHLAKNEEKLAHFLGYYPGPYQITNEVHRVQNWTRFIRTKFCRVVRAGNRKLTELVGAGDTHTIAQENSVFSPIPDKLVITYENLTNLSPACNFWVYPEGYEEKDEWALRPYEITSYDGSNLELCFPLWAAIDPVKYYTFPNERNIIKQLMLCDESNYIQAAALYQESWELPHGYVRLATENCPNCNGQDSDNCEVCALPAIPICLKPRDWKKGIFSFTPIVNTGTEATPCWQELDNVESCCQQLANDSLIPISARFMNQCYCTMPLDVEINYVSSCDGSWFDSCLTYETCPELLGPLAELTLADMPPSCNCGCLEDKKTHLQQDMLRLRERERLQNVTSEMIKFGTRRGDIEAYLTLLNFVDRKKSKLSYL